MGTITGKSINKSFAVKGLSCASCAISVQSMLKSVKGVHDASVNFASKNANVSYDSKLSQTELKKAVQSIGYDLVIDENLDEEGDEGELKEYRQIRMNFIGALCFSIPVVIMGMFFHHQIGFAGNLVSSVLTLIVLAWFGRMFFVKALKLASHFQTNMDTLVALSTGSAYVFSVFNTFFPSYLESKGLEPFVYFETSAVIVTFILLGKLLEKRATSRAFFSIKNLMNLRPSVALAIIDGKMVEVNSVDLKIDDLIIVRPGEKVAVDGQVVHGKSYINESMISGEPVPVLKIKGEHVLAGTLNQNGALTIKVTKTGEETVLSQIIHSVKNAQDSKAPVQKLVDKVASVFVPAVIIVAFVTLVVWLIIGGAQIFPQAFYSAITVLIIACPCALGLATPIAIMVGVGRGAKEGILIKDAQSLELAHKIDTLILDKTGTITKGFPEVTEVLWDSEVKNKEQSINILYSLEKKSEHPLAKAVCKKLKDEIGDEIEFNEFENIPGKGIAGKTLNGDQFYAGTYSFISENGILVSDLLKSFSDEAEGNSVVYFSDDKRVHGILLISDQIKESATEAISEIKERGIGVHMVTGDHEKAAQFVAQNVGIKNYLSGALPNEKLLYIKNLQAKGKVVAMAGDGINDAEALAQAQVGIAMAKGTDIAMDVAQITLMQSDPRQINSAINLSKLTMKVIKQNLFWAFIFNLIGIPVAAGVLVPFTGFQINPMIAGAAMAMSSVLVVFNSLRLKSIKL